MICINLSEFFNSLPTQTPVGANAFEHSLFVPILIKEILSKHLLSRPLVKVNPLGCIHSDGVVICDNRNLIA